MKRWLPYPTLSLALLAMWLLLNESAAAAHWLMGLLFALAGGWVLAQLHPPLGRVRRRAGAAAILGWLVFADIVRSNIAVARIALRPESRSRIAGFLHMPLELRHPGALAVLACIITATPGTSWARYDAGSNVVTIHVLDLVDEDAWIRQFKDRYEQRLKEIFE
jgi:multicomponent K+:H+ antiporter subunit E